MAPALFIEGDAAIGALEPCAAEAPIDPAGFELPYRHQTRLCDISEETGKENENEDENENDDADSTGSWQAIPPSGNDEIGPSGYDDDDEITRMFRQEYGQFYKAAAHGDINVLNEKLVMGLKIEKETSIGFTALVIAISEMQVDAVKLLLGKGANVHHRVNDLPPLAHAASRSEHGPELLQLLIDSGANLNTVSKPDARNVLHCAAAVGTPETIEFLVSKGMNLEKRCRRGCTPLLVAARAGNIENARVLLRLGAKLDVVSLNGGGPLIWSSCRENIDAVKFWLEQGVDIDLKDRNGQTSLFLACHYGALETVNVLLENGADYSISSTKPGHFSPLMAAVSADHAGIVKTLVANGCDLNYKNSVGETALDLAIMDKRLKVVPVLLELMGGENYPKDSPALQIALANGYGMVKSLMHTLSLVWPSVTNTRFGEHGWVDWVLSEGGNLVRPMAAFKMMHVALEEQNIDMVRTLAKEGCDITGCLESGHTPLSFAVDHRNLELIQVLLDHAVLVGADINTPRAGKNKFSPLDDAIIDMQDGTDTEVVDLLLKSGRCRINSGKNPASTAFSYVLSKADLEAPQGPWGSLAARMIDSILDVNNDRCAVGCSLPHVATLRQSEKFIDLLLSKGADIEAKNQLGCTPLIMASQYAWKMIRILLERGANINAKYKSNSGALAAAASYGNVESLIELVHVHGMDVEVQTEQGYTPFGCALTWEQEDAAKYLLSRGANVHWKTHPTNHTALHFAAKYNLKSVVVELLEKGVNVNARDIDGWTPLHEACALSSPDLVRLLLDAGADIEAELPNKDRPLHVALINEQQYIARLLIEYGASISARASKNRTPLHLCAEYNLTSAASLLLERGVSVEELLLNEGADIDVRTTDDGLSVMERASDIVNREDRVSFMRLLMKTITMREAGEGAREENEDDDRNGIGEVGGRFEIV